MTYPDTMLHIDGAWAPASGGRTLPVVNPATNAVIGQVAHAEVADLDRVLAAADRGFQAWRQVPALERGRLLSRAASNLRQRLEEAARLMVLEQGKPLAEARGEIERSCEVIDWMAGECQRVYGRTIPPRTPNLTQTVIKEPVGVVVAFTPWNFPVNQMIRKVAAALAAGCAIIVKGPEETPASAAELVAAFTDAGLPPGVLNLVYGTPAQISEYLIPSPVVRKVSFTGSTAVGKHLAALAGQHMKLMTMELGGHAPVIVFDDIDVDQAVAVMAANKWRNAGQTCISPTRFIVQDGVYDRFVDAFVANARAVKVGDGLDPASTMGALANPRRLEAMEALVADAVAHGARVRTGGGRIGNAGNFFEPTVITDLPTEARLMNEEPFGPIALVQPFSGIEDALAEANRLPYGLAAYAFTTSSLRARAAAAGIQSGMVSINHFGLGVPETPFGGMKDSGYGFEGGAEAIEAYLQTRFITTADL